MMMMTKNKNVNKMHEKRIFLEFSVFENFSNFEKYWKNEKKKISVF